MKDGALILKPRTGLNRTGSRPKALDRNRGRHTSTVKIAFAPPTLCFLAMYSR